jgi:hypothetical protein
MLNQPSLQLLTDKFQHLGHFEQKELLDFAEFLSQKQQAARKEIWDNFAN